MKISIFKFSYRRKWIGRKIMNNEVDFYTVLQSVKKSFLRELQKYPSKSYNKETLIDSKKCYRAIIELENCMGELIVDVPEYAPYRYVNFNILSTIAHEKSTVFCWYDSKSNSLENITNKIKEGLEKAFQFNSVQNISI